MSKGEALIVFVAVMALGMTFGFAYVAERRGLFRKSSALLRWLYALGAMVAALTILAGIIALDQRHERVNCLGEKQMSKSEKPC